MKSWIEINKFLMSYELSDLKTSYPKSYEYNRTIEKLYKLSHEAALEYAFRCWEDTIEGTAFFFISRKGTDGRLWGSSRTVNRRDLEGRQYILSITDTRPVHVNIFFTDELFDPKTRKVERLGEKD